MIYEQYKESVKADIEACMENLQVQPILFVGSGMSQRYFDAPCWDTLMLDLAERCPLITKRFAYYQQQYAKDNTKIASVFADTYSEWAWEDGQDKFPNEMFEPEVTKDSYIKYEVASYINGLADKFDVKANAYRDEIESLRKVKPHSIITTNYDDALEKIFPDYHKVVGQEIVRANYTSYGEILKMHGCSSQYETIVLTAEDYTDFNKRKKYLSAKLLTYFAEHPLFFFGYSATDTNIKGILSDIDEILAPNGELIPNIYMVCFEPDSENKRDLPTEQLVTIDATRSVRLKVIYASGFKWIFDALSSCTPEITVNPRLIRSLLARTYQLANSDLPKQELPFNFKMLQDIEENSEKLPTLFGITHLTDVQALNANFDYTLTDVAKALGGSYWNHAEQLLNKIWEDKGVNIKNSDNNYHLSIKTGAKSMTHKYSQNAVDLLQKVQNGEEYNLDL
ncbi:MULTISPECIES: SIR2 family NAD-dependent protein deacylase [Vibrionaceae]|uniref:SIR2 family protein n=4 Tax=Vibrionaceae TaxID=641 RepID=A0A1P8DQN1_VIBPH|nr:MULTISPECIES: SIR2 family protein [Vibrionaceae]APU91418.1 SIR2 family protein [Vibrio parahaemolyticus]AWB03262.1 SIR2 family protein [Vibrio harveyi]MBO0139337.1 SIR2 family protein [Vibrio sp. Vb2736]MBO0184996.1 SIR2 family protein [Vibrio parahaemolyticus]MBO0189029.1 SIR2 family protein [Vibrio parahaemolyticus]